MFLIIGYVIILLASLGTYAVHGSLAALWVPMEYLAIVGLMMDDMEPANGPLLIIPGSHKGPVHDHHAEVRFCGVPASEREEKPEHKTEEAP